MSNHSLYMLCSLQNLLSHKCGLMEIWQIWESAIPDLYTALKGTPCTLPLYMLPRTSDGKNILLKPLAGYKPLAWK